MEPRKALGRGIASLLTQKKREDVTPLPPAVPLLATGPYLELDPKQILSDKGQPRKYFDDTKIQELAISIKNKGILQPLLVRKLAEDHYELISGERRWRAAQIAGLAKVPVIVREVIPQEQLELALIENLQRADLDAMEEAQGFADLMERFQLTQEEVAEKVGVGRSAIANSLRLLKLPDKLQQALRSGGISVGHAKVLLGEPIDKQLYLLDKILESQLTVRELEKLLKRWREKTSEVTPVAPRVAEVSSFLDRLTEELRHRLGTQVKIEATDKGGKIVIEYYSDEQLDELYQVITGYNVTRRKTTTRGVV